MLRISRGGSGSLYLVRRSCFRSGQFLEFPTLILDSWLPSSLRIVVRSAVLLLRSVCPIRHFLSVVQISARFHVLLMSLFPRLLLPVLYLFLVGLFLGPSMCYFLHFSLLAPVMIDVSIVRCRCSNNDNSRRHFLCFRLLLILRLPTMGVFRLAGFF